MDFVVNTNRLSRGMLREDGVQIYTSRDNQTSHNVFQTNQIRNKLFANALVKLIKSKSLQP